MTEADIPEGAKIRPTPHFRWKKKAGGAGRTILQQWVQVEADKTVFFCWRSVPSVPASASDEARGDA